MDERDMFEQAYKNGYEQGKQDAVKWIPVTERLPEYGENVLAYLENKITVLRHYNGFFEKTLGVRHGKLVYLDVTHWMSLPESPKE